MVIETSAQRKVRFEKASSVAMTLVAPQHENRQEDNAINPVKAPYENTVLRLVDAKEMPSPYLLDNVLMQSRGTTHALQRIIKRALDVVLSGVLLVLASPIMLVVAFMVKSDGGPAFFGHKRLGMAGKTFPCLKFRSMIHNSEAVLEKHLAENPQAQAEWAVSRKLKHDPRVTRFGSFLRKSSLDELPQLLNVLHGDMSLVGPRPIVTAETAHYQADIAYYYAVRPGVTGLWQVSGRSDTTYAQRVGMDASYVRNWSLWNDIVILVKTPIAVLKSSGAY